MNAAGIKLRESGLSLLLLCAVNATAATFSEWQFQQQFEITQPGLIKFALPIETLDASRANLPDLRLADAAGNELPYLIEKPVLAGRQIRGVKSFRVELVPRSTVITLETGVAQEISAVRLLTPSSNFIKAVSLAGSADGKSWQDFATGQPIFQQPNGANQLRLELTPHHWSFLRLTVDDTASAPIPFTGADLELVQAELPPTERFVAQINKREENPGETRLLLNLGAAHQWLASVEIESPDLLFRRQITLVARELDENTIKEKSLASGSIYRVAIAGQPAASKVSVPLDLQTSTRELSLLIHNGDSPPIRVTAVRFARHPIYCLFLAPTTGRFTLFTGNPLCPAPRYDLANEPIDIKATPLTAIALTPVKPNPNYQVPEALPKVPDAGATLDLSKWRFRKQVQLSSAGIAQLELDLDVLAQAQTSFADLRLMHDGRQVPFILERTSTLRTLAPQTARADDPRQPRFSRWSIQAPHPRLPFTTLTCASQTALFRREVILYEEPMDSRGSRYRHELGRATWSQAPDRTKQTLMLMLAEPPMTDAFILEVNNEDNPGIELNHIELRWPATRLLFKTSTPDGLFLFYGNPEAPFPRYDLSLVANQLLAADKAIATPGRAEQLKSASWSERHKGAQGGWILWTVLGIVVVSLLAVISRLVPKSDVPQ